MIVLLAILGGVVTIAVIAGAIMLVPKRTERLRHSADDQVDPQGSELTPVDRAS